VIELIRNCSHKSEVFLYLSSENGVPRWIIKVAITPEGIKNLKSDLAGATWYANLLGGSPDKLPQVMLETPHCLKIRIPFIQGEMASYFLGITKTKPAISQVIQHYLEIWPYSPNKLSPLHGDLSLGNAILSPDGVHLFDWEHFNPEAAFWGFDAMYLLMECLYYSVRKHHAILPQDIAAIAGWISTLNSHHALPAELLDAPLHFTNAFIQENDSLWAGQASKLPIALFTPEETQRIDQLLRADLSA
jgi:hypothetical protein